ILAPGRAISEAHIWGRDPVPTEGISRKRLFVTGVQDDLMAPGKRDVRVIPSGHAQPRDGRMMDREGYPRIRGGEMAEGGMPGMSPSEGGAPGPVPSPAPAPDAPYGSGPPAGWYRDPDGGHEYRYWNGSAWTPGVADGSTVGQDPPGAGGARGRRDG